MNEIAGENICFSYDLQHPALQNVSIEVKKGELCAILGQNGCGKSTLACQFNALLRPKSGRLTVHGMDVMDEGCQYELRRACSMVFQNPENQFISTVVEEDIAFGPENYEIPEEEIIKRIGRALESVGMQGYEKRSTHMLSGGQKQRIAIAGVLAMEPDILIFDEATAMLDPEGRDEVLEIIRSLHEKDKTIVMITHLVEEAAMADCVYLMQEGSVLAKGSPRQILTDQVLLQKAGLKATIPTRLYFDLLQRGIRLSYCPLTEQELLEAVPCR